MKKIFLILVAFSLLIPSVEAMKVYSYDSNGNRVYRDVVSKYAHVGKPTVTSYSRKYTNVQNTSARTPSMPVSQSFIYDEKGNRTGKISRLSNGQTFVYDANGNRVRKYSTRGNQTFVYDGNGNRVRKYSTVNNRTYVYNGAGNRVGSYSTVRYR